MPEADRDGSFWSATRTGDELSVVCREEVSLDSRAVSTGWACLRVVGPLDFGLTGVLAGIAAPLAEADISIFTISTFDTDYILVRDRDLETARAALVAAGHGFDNPAGPSVVD